MADENAELARIRGLLWGFRASCVLVAAVQVGLIDQLARGPAGVEELARVLGLHAGALARLLRVLTGYGLVELHEARYRLAGGGRALQLLRDFAILIGAEYLPAWSRLADSLRSGEPAFEQVFGMSVWQHRAENPELNQALHRTMTSYQQSRPDALLAGCDLSDLGLFVDLGGSHGDQVIEVLRRYPRARAILFDLPQVVPGARARLAAAGLAERCQVVGGSFFEELPAGGSVYLLKHVLHNWSDQECLQLLCNCRRALSAGSRLLVVERIMPARPSSATPDGHWDIGLMDLHMLTVLGGRERTSGEFDALFAAAGLARSATRAVGGGDHIIELLPRPRAPEAAPERAD